ncbi:hypothetical protein FOZ61_010500 [Perkinsus olseni]|uniref:Uncharacterized protein n=1 Tax=Perkinsus olseni TaxID=32597 RepID=A0A7J6M2Q3_PEROL|nr:hypothetical protein FOZ61_010500 [Perkinsus olseni]KAF4668099.1 hypothetical protein FOL46_002164 [Perkinsus olseni]
MRGYFVLSSLIGLAAVAQPSMEGADVTADFALDMPAAQRTKFDAETIANVSELEKDIIDEADSIWSWMRQVIASPLSTGDYACLTMKAHGGKRRLRQTIQIGYCEPLGTNMSFEVSIGHVTKSLHLPEWLDPSGGSITFPKFFSQVYDDTQCTVNSTIADAGLASLPDVHHIHIGNGKCVVKIEEEPLPTLPPTAEETTTTPSPTQTTTTPSPTQTSTTPAPSETPTPTIQSDTPVPSAAEPEIDVSADVTVN